MATFRPFLAEAAVHGFDIAEVGARTNCERGSTGSEERAMIVLAVLLLSSFSNIMRRAEFSGNDGSGISGVWANCGQSLRFSQAANSISARSLRLG
jgi:hypothetical protein